jgi:SPP1 family predicted phage head-tail adaptor
MALQYRTPTATPAWKKDRQVTIQAFTQASQDGRGQPTGSWGNLATDPTVWASVEPLNVRTSEYAHQLYAQATHRVFIDYRSDVTKAMRLLYGTRYLYVGHLINVGERNVTLELLCVEGDP